MRCEFDTDIFRSMNRKKGIPIEESLLSNQLKRYGYNTGIVGKWHVG